MNKYLAVISLLLALIAGYCFYQWQMNYLGSISVYVPKDGEIIIEGEFINIKTNRFYEAPLEYGRYIIRVPDYNIECMIHKNNRGNAFINVVDVNDFSVECDSNAHVVE